MAIALMMLGKVDAVLVDTVRNRVTDAVTPILDALSQPAATVSNVAEQVGEMTDLAAENERLRTEIANLVQFRDAAYRLESENERLRTLMNFRPAVPHTYVSGRVVADNSGTFVRSLVINVGARDGVADGQAVMGGEGLIGRIVQTGQRSSRVLLITDLNARVPIVVQRTRDRAVLGGDNTAFPRLFHLTVDHGVRIGDRISTSGYGGMFPPGLPIGRVGRADDGVVRIRPLEDLTRVEFVRVVDFSEYLETGSITAVPQPPR